MTRVIHTGDTHIGYQQYHSPERRQDFMRAFERVVDDAVEADVDAVVHAGDLFHDRRPELQDLLGTIAALRTLEAANIPFLAIVGNHESTRGGQWLDLFERLGLARRLDSEPVTVGDVALYGLDHVARSRRDELTYDFADHDAAFAALVAHGLFEPFAHGDWDTETVLAEASVDFDAMLLGDNHVPDTAAVRDTWVTYCGSTERASASERDARGYNLVEFDADAAESTDSGPPAGVDIRRRSLDDVTREFAFVSVDLAAGVGVERVREQLRQRDLDGAVVIVEITGDGEPVAPADVESFAADRGALIARVTDRREEPDVEADLSVSFADPDEAVRQRLSGMGLSTAARDIDEVVRTSKTADSNVRDRVRDRIGELLEEPAAFAPAEDAAADSTADEAESAPVTTEETSDASGETSDASGETADVSNEADEPSDEANDDDSTADPSTSDATGNGESTDSAPAEDSSAADPPDGVAPAEEPTDGQASMEEYL